jgi:hypothetical protein
MYVLNTRLDICVQQPLLETCFLPYYYSIYEIRIFVNQYNWLPYNTFIPKHTQVSNQIPQLRLKLHANFTYVSFYMR